MKNDFVQFSKSNQNPTPDLNITETGVTNSKTSDFLPQKGFTERMGKIN